MNLLSEFQEKCIKELMDGMEKKNHDLGSTVNDAIPPLGSGSSCGVFSAMTVNPSVRLN